MSQSFQQNSLKNQANQLRKLCQSCCTVCTESEGVGGVVAWPMAHNRKVVGSSLVSAQLIPSPLAVIKANAGPLYMTT